MQQMGLEPTRIAPHVPETCAYTNCATAANTNDYILIKKISQEKKFAQFKKNS